MAQVQDCPFCGNVMQDEFIHKRNCFIQLIAEKLNGSQIDEARLAKAWDRRAKKHTDYTPGVQRIKKSYRKKR
jgi:hypothetical protein